MKTEWWARLKNNTNPGHRILGRSTRIELLESLQQYLISNYISLDNIEIVEIEIVENIKDRKDYVPDLQEITTQRRVNYINEEFFHTVKKSKHKAVFNAKYCAVCYNSKNNKTFLSKSALERAGDYTLFLIKDDDELVYYKLQQALDGCHDLEIFKELKIG